MFLVEQTPKLVMGASTRNSGVIHSGIYYPPGSLARGCAWRATACCTNSAPRTTCRTAPAAKLPVVAHDAKQEAELEHLAENGRANGVAGLRLVDRAAAARAREPHIEAAAALLVPSTGIVAEDLIKTLARMATDQGATACWRRTRVVRLGPARRLDCRNTVEEMQKKARSIPRKPSRRAA